MIMSIHISPKRKKATFFGFVLPEQSKLSVDLVQHARVPRGFAVGAFLRGRSTVSAKEPRRKRH